MRGRPPVRALGGWAGSKCSLFGSRLRDVAQRDAEDVMIMASGGARARSGPPADPNALRRDRKDDAAWVTLPAKGFSGVVPEWPIGAASGSETALWARLWRKPQAFMWDQLQLEFEVAAYVRAFLESVEPEASAGLKTAVLRMSAELGLSTVGMGQLRWKIAVDEVARKREQVKSAGVSARDRLKVLNA